jgi:hypothetical protein
MTVPEWEIVVAIGCLVTGIVLSLSLIGWAAYQ